MSAYHLFTGTPTQTGKVRIECNGTWRNTVDPEDVGYYLIWEVCGEQAAEQFDEDFDRVVCSQFDGRGFSIWADHVRHTVDQLQKCFGK